MYTFLSIIYVLVCLFLVLVVLLQPGRGGVGGAFGGGSSQTVFGGSGAGNFLTRLTSISAALFMILSASLAYMSSSSDKSLDRAAEAARAKTAALKAKQDADKSSAATSDAGAAAPVLEQSTEGALEESDEPAAPAVPTEAQPAAAPQEAPPATAPADTKPAAPTLRRITPPTAPKTDPATQPTAPVTPTTPNQ
jgi:preprotein translocase subunit SecG